MKNMKRSFTVHDLPLEERPRERLQRLGEQVLSAQEILALILGRGTSGESVMVTAQRLLSRFGSLKAIASASLEELTGVKGVGMAKATQIKAAFELARRIESHTELTSRPVIDTPQKAFKLVKGRLKDKKKEHFLAILLDTRNRSLAVAQVSVGSLNASIVHPREVFKEAVSATAASIILVHNHPSGDLTPSEEDIRLTRRFKEASEVMGIEVIDHIIVAGDDFISLKAEGII